MNINLVFCRNLLKSAIAEVRIHFPAVQTKFAWVWHIGRNHWEFHGPEAFYWHGSADNAYDARYKGWMAWLKHKGVFDDDLPEGL